MWWPRNGISLIGGQIMPTGTTARIDNITSVTAESRYDRSDPKLGAAFSGRARNHEAGEPLRAAMALPSARALFSQPTLATLIAYFGSRVGQAQKHQRASRTHLTGVLTWLRKAKPSVTFIAPIVMGQMRFKANASALSVVSHDGIRTECQQCFTRP